MSNKGKLKDAERYISEKSWDEVGLIGNKMLSWNKFDDDGMRLAVLSNKGLQKDALAHKIYADFSKNYKIEIGEDYPVSYNNIITYHFRSIT